MQTQKYREKLTVRAGVNHWGQPDPNDRFYFDDPLGKCTLSRE